MSTFFTNPQVKKWKRRFFISFMANIIFLVAFIAIQFEDENSEKREPSKTTVEDEMREQKKAEKKSAETPKKAEKGEFIPVTIEIKDSFYSSFANSGRVSELSEKFTMSNLAELLSAHVARPLRWKLELRKDIRNGDELSFVFRIIPKDEKRERDDMPDDIEVAAVKYFSKKFNKNIEMYFFKPESKKYGKFYYKDGMMVEKLLKTPPIKEYIQVTSLLKDRRPKHDGIDFKAPTGTKVYSTVNGVVSRTNWKTKYNGYTVEIKAKGSSHVLKYLHLSDVLVKRGQKVEIGDHIANSGNTGKSFAPHLHYQLNIGIKGKAVTPFDHFDTHNITLKDSELDSFRKSISDFNKIFAKKD